MKSGEKIFWGAFALIVIAVLGVFMFYRIQHPIAVTTNTNTVTSAITSADWTKGPSGAKVSVIEYGDFQCPACGQYEPIMAQLRTEYAGKVLFVFRNFPLYQIHPNAGIAAQAAEAAGTFGKYWEMHDLLYAKQTTWVGSQPSDVVQKYFDVYAQSLGIDVNAFNAAINSDAVKSKIATDVASANAAAVNHTPTFFLNLKQIPNPNSIAEFKAVIDAALSAPAAQ